MLWEKQNIEPIEDDIKEFEKMYDSQTSEILSLPKIVSVDGKKGLWSLEEVINLLRTNEIRFKIVL